MAVTLLLRCRLDGVEGGDVQLYAGLMVEHTVAVLTYLPLAAAGLGLQHGWIRLEAFSISLSWKN